MMALLALCKVAFLAPLAWHFWSTAVVGAKDVIAASVVATGAFALLSPGGELCGTVITALGVLMAWLQGSLSDQPLFAFSSAGGCALVFALSLTLKRLRAVQPRQAVDSESSIKKSM